jgi:hypothetical protein
MDLNMEVGAHTDSGIISRYVKANFIHVMTLVIFEMLVLLTFLIFANKVDMLNQMILIIIVFKVVDTTSKMILHKAYKLLYRGNVMLTMKYYESMQSFLAQAGPEVRRDYDDYTQKIMKELKDETNE